MTNALVPKPMNEKAATAMATQRFGRELATVEKENREVLIQLIQTGFNPWTDLTLYERRPFVTIDGWYNAVKRAGRQITAMPTRVIKPEERDTYALKEDEVGCVCEVYIEGHLFACGFGKASPTHPHRGRQPVEVENPFRMAEKRAESQGLRKVLRAVGMNYEVGTIDQDTVIEGEAQVVDEPAEQVSPPQEQPKPAIDRESKYYCEKHETTWVKTGSDFAHKIEGSDKYCVMPTQ